MAKKYIVTVNGTSYEVVVEDADPNATYTKAPNLLRRRPRPLPPLLLPPRRLPLPQPPATGKRSPRRCRVPSSRFWQAGRCRQERRRALHHRSDENGKRDYGPLRRNGFRRFGQRGRIGQRRRPLFVIS